MTRWGMVIDLKRCIGCYSCMVACKQEHFLPPNIFWTRVLISESGQYPWVTNLLFPVLCNHCREAICVKVCPAGATTQREDGIVDIEYDKCVGCRYCVIACPYQQRQFHSGKESFLHGRQSPELELIGKEIFPIQPGTVLKCTFCKEKIDEGISRGLNPGVDFEATPACVSTCPVKVRCFGDLDDPESEVSELIRRRKGIQLHPEFGTDPSIYYID